ncbi:MAG: serine/threonine protein kinase, partial [Methanomicrobiales archaeon]|nr:serine/threonine protein kinase [Methanomicrobiales archaeon]
GKTGLITLAVPLTAPVVYLGLSALLPSRGAARGSKHPLLATLHVPLAVLALAGLAAIYAMTPVRREAAVLTLAASLLGSALMAFWHGPKAPVRGPARAPAGATILSPPVETGTDPQAASPSPAPATRFPPELEGRFRGAEYLGGGGVARVYRARMEPEGKEVVVKIPLRSDEATGRSFLREIRVWEELHHPRIVEILSANILPIPYVVMEYHPRSLDRVHLPLPVPEAAHLMAGILEGLAHAHARGIVHRDLKPQNILLGADGEPRIADWGLSSTLSGGTPGTVEGFSLGYAAPEQIAPERFGGTDSRTDLYQAGILFYELVTGRVPFPGGSLAEQTRAILEDTPDPPSSRVPAARSVDRIILRCLEKEKFRRYGSAEEMAADLATAVSLR